MSRIKTAVIPAAGFGTRMFPVTKTISKEMLPVGNRPIIDYVVEDCLGAGIEEIIIVIHEQETQIPHFYQEEHVIYEFLEQRDALHKYAPLESLPEKATFTFVTQPSDGRYGTAIPLLAAEESIRSDSFVYLNGDALVWNDGQSSLGGMVTSMKQAQMPLAVGSLEVNPEDVSKYGVMKLENNGNGPVFKGIVEKPPVEEAPSNQINIGTYVLNKDIFPILHNLEPDEKSGEYYVTEAVNQLAKDQDMYVHPLQGAFLDVGTPENFIKANNFMKDFL